MKTLYSRNQQKEKKIILFEKPKTKEKKLLKKPTKANKK